jgi:hypothetical protein
MEKFTHYLYYMFDEVDDISHILRYPGSVKVGLELCNASLLADQ